MLLASASMVRAAIMGGLNSLAFVAAWMALADPNVLWDVGSQLPFMATLGLVRYAEPLTRAFKRATGSRLQPGMVLGGLAVLLRLAYQPLR